MNTDKTILVCGKIYASFDPLRTVECFAAENGIITYAGDRKTARKFAGNSYMEVTPGSGVILPGFVDPHLHPALFGESIAALHLENAGSIAELKKQLGRYIDHSTGDLIVGYGWNEENFVERRIVNRKDIEEISAGKKVVLYRSCLHTALMNTPTLDYFFSGDTGGNEVDRETGIVRENALLRTGIRSEMDKMNIAKGLDALLKMGITSAGYMNCSLNDIRILEQMDKEGDLPLRVVAYMEPCCADRISKYNSPFLKAAGIKIFLDGSFGSRTALLSEPYADDPENSGRCNTDLEAAVEIGKKAEENGLVLSAHAIGDRAVDIAIELGKRLKNRIRIEHGSLMRDDQIISIKEIGAVVVTQPQFITSDYWLPSRLGERTKKTYRLQDMLKADITMAFSSDAPVEYPDPWKNIRAATLCEPYRRIGLQQAFKAHTETAADALQLNAGKLEKGRYADFIVVETDPFYAGEITGNRVLSVYVNGLKAL